MTNTIDYNKHPKRTHIMKCRHCGMEEYYENIADDPNDDLYGICGECEMIKCEKIETNLGPENL